MDHSRHTSYFRKLVAQFNKWIAKPSPRSILVVEDDVFLKATVARVLYSADPQVSIRWVTNATEALHAIIEEKPDLLIADCLLGPGPSGMDLWEECEKKYPDISFLMISGLGPQSIRKYMSSENGGFPELIQKPLRFMDFRNRVKALLHEGAAS